MSIKHTLGTAKKHGLTLKVKEKWEGRDGIGFNAVLLVNGKKVADVHQGGYGGCTDINALGTVDKDKNGEYKQSKQLIENRKILKDLEEKLAQEPEYLLKSPFGERMTTDDLEFIIDCLFDEEEFQKVIKKHQNQGVLIEDEDGNGFYPIKFGKGKGQTIPTLIKNYGMVSVKATLQNCVNKKKAEGKTIVNQEYLEKLGVKF